MATGVPHKAKGSKKGRKIGRGIRKAAKSRFGSYAGIIGASTLRKELRGIARNKRLKRLRDKRGGFHTKRAALRFARFGPPRSAAS